MFVLITLTAYRPTPSVPNSAFQPVKDVKLCFERHEIGLKFCIYPVRCPSRRLTLLFEPIEVSLYTSGCMWGRTRVPVSHDFRVRIATKICFLS